MDSVPPVASPKRGAEGSVPGHIDPGPVEPSGGSAKTLAAKLRVTANRLEALGGPGGSWMVTLLRDAAEALDPSGFCEETECPFNRVRDTVTGLVGRMRHRHEADGSVRTVWL